MAAAASPLALVTGATGFVGTNLCARLLKEGWRVVGVDCFATSHRNNLEENAKHPNFTFIEHDVVEPIPADKIAGMKFDYIFNLACPASPPHYQRDPIWTMKTAFLGTMNVLELAKAHGAIILQASTSEVYGDPKVHPQPETYNGYVSCTGVRACYDEGKRIGETLCFEYHRKHGVQVRVIRIFNTYGPKMHPYDGRVVSNFIRQALSGENLTIYGTGNQTRSFQFVTDLLDGMLSMITNPQGFVGPVNIGNPTEFTMKELAEMVVEMVGSGSKIVYMEAAADDPAQRKPVIEVAAKELGWAPRVPLRQGLGPTIDYFRALDIALYQDHLQTYLAHTPK